MNKKMSLTCMYLSTWGKKLRNFLYFYKIVPIILRKKMYYDNILITMSVQLYLLVYRTLDNLVDNLLINIFFLW